MGAPRFGGQCGRRRPRPISGAAPFQSCPQASRPRDFGGRQPLTGLERRGDRSLDGEAAAMAAQVYDQTPPPPLPRPGWGPVATPVHPRQPPGDGDDRRVLAVSVGRDTRPCAACVLGTMQSLVLRKRRVTLLPSGTRNAGVRGQGRHVAAARTSTSPFLSCGHGALRERKTVSSRAGARERLGSRRARRGSPPRAAIRSFRSGLTAPLPGDAGCGGRCPDMGHLLRFTPDGRAAACTDRLAYPGGGRSLPTRLVWDAASRCCRIRRTGPGTACPASADVARRGDPRPRLLSGDPHQLRTPQQTGGRAGVGTTGTGDVASRRHPAVLLLATGRRCPPKCSIRAVPRGR